MKINDSYTSKRTGITQNICYEELDSFDTIRSLPMGAVGAFCFYGDRIVLVYAKNRDTWEIPGGGCEFGETFEESIIREIKEESNMKVLNLFPLGYDIFTNTETKENNYVARYAAKVEPYGPFVKDLADGEITAMKLIEPKDYTQYFDWGERSKVMMKKALCLVLGVEII